ncbi:hypothetical protein GCM10027051_16140 [Niabella terrae]
MITYFEPIRTQIRDLRKAVDHGESFGDLLELITELEEIVDAVEDECLDHTPSEDAVLNAIGEIDPDKVLELIEDAEISHYLQERGYGAIKLQSANERSAFEAFAARLHP